MKTTLAASASVSRVNPWLVLAVIGLGSITSSLLGSAVNVTLPAIRAEFGVDLSVIEWVVTGYLLTTSSLLIFFGRLGDMVGHKRVYATGWGFFTLGSLACGVAPSIWLLIAGRVLQAVGGAMLMAPGPALITAAFPVEKRGQALGLMAAAVYAGLTLGPTFGGLISGWLGWHWVFLILGPLGAVCLVMSVMLLPGGQPVRRQGFDPAGALLFAAALSALLATLSKGGTWGWGSPLTLGALGAALVAGLAFVWVEGKVAAPMVPLGMFRNLVFTSGVSAALVNYAVGSMLSFLLPFYLMELRGFPSSQAGLMMSAQALSMVTMAPLSGWFSDKVGTRGLAATGLAIQGGSLLLMTLLGTTAAPWLIFGVGLVMGVGVGLFTTPNNSAIMGAASKERQGVASGLLAAARSTGMILGVAMSSAIFRGLQVSYAAAGTPAESAFLRSMNGSLYTGALLAAVGVALALTRGKASQE